jgi:hypothetical protein
MTLYLTTFEQWFWHVWDNLWRLVACNVLLVLACAPLLTPIPPLQVLWVVLVLGPLLAATVAWAWAMADDRSPGARDLILALRRVYLRAVGLHALLVLVAAILTLNLTFYLGEAGRRAIGVPGGLFLAGLALWIGVFLAILYLWTLVALGETRDEGPRSLFGAIRQGGRILLVHPLLSFAHAATLVLFSAVMIWTQVGAILLWLAAVAVYLATAVAEMYYESEAKAQTAGKQEPDDTPKPTSWKEIIRDERPGAAPGRRPRRSLREIFKPWEMD